MAAALDRTKVTDREAPHLLAATADALGHDIQELPLSRSSIRRARMQYREEFATDLRSKFTPSSALVVHWDGKLLPDITGKQKVDRLPVIVSGVETEQLLGVPKITSGTGEAQAAAVVRCIDDWNVRDIIRGLCFDTTASNTGQYAGACSLIQKALDRELLHLACRHHIMEIVAEKAFSIMKIATSTGPDILLFKRFQDNWNRIDQSNFQTAADAVETADFKARIIHFAETNIEIHQPRDDYRELLELAIIFLGGTPRRGVHFTAPGALHRARWMARIIYSFKMWMFRSQFKLKAGEEKGIFQFLLFICDVYIEAWFQAPRAVTAPANDLRLLRQLSEYRNQAIRQATVTAFNRHLWYLSEITIGLAFFDPQIDFSEKQTMISNMQRVQAGSDHPPPRLDSKFVDASQPLSAFVTTNTRKFFEILQLSDAFLKLSPEQWKENSDYVASEQIVSALTVVNDSVERGVKLIQDYNSLLTKNEEQKQYLLQVVQEHRHKFPDSKKGTLLLGLSKAE